MLKGAVDQAAQAVTEGRNAVRGLRASTVVPNDLAEAINARRDAHARSGARTHPVFRVEVEGASRELTMWSGAESGMEIELTIPGPIAHAKSPTPSAAVSGEAT